MNFTVDDPIGIFDSGIGGLTVAKAVNSLLPNENIIYFGDTAHLPYGEKSQASIQAYSVKICHLLLEKRCKMILIACNSASAAAFDLVKAYVGSYALVQNVIDPMVELLGNQFTNRRVGLIGTRTTVNSKVYEQKVAALQKNIDLQCLATPLLASAIEEGFFNNSVSEAIVNQYLADEKLKGIDALVLACTHYPLIKPQIEAYYDYKVEVIDSSLTIAQHVRQSLAEERLLRSSGEKPSTSFFVSDYTESFQTAAGMFFGNQIKLQHYRLWE